MDVNDNAYNGYHNTNCPSARQLAMVQTDREAHNEGVACVWMAENETFGSMYACSLSSSRLSICRERPQPGHCVTDLSPVH